MKRTVLVAAVLLGIPLSVLACLWDSDTPASEAKGMPEVVAVLAGRFERNPPLYYEMRLKRVTAELQSRPEDLAAYDDAGVACDRLGRGDEAISWMKRKLAILEKVDPPEIQATDNRSRLEASNHRYRCHANLGTFLVHRWARQGADRARLDEVKTSRDEIAKALAINPDAHFGREKCQLQAIDWIISPPEWKGRQYLPNLLGFGAGGYSGKAVDPKVADDAVRGLSGLVVLGNAWESVDIFYALNFALQHDNIGFGEMPEGGRNTLAYLAWLRCSELIDAGKGSMLPDAPKGEDLKKLLERPEFIQPNELLDAEFKRLRSEADVWHKARTTFMTKRLDEGCHPDTDRDFWKGYHQDPTPELSAMSVPQVFKERTMWNERVALAVLIGVPILLVTFVVVLAKSKASSDRKRVLREL